MKILAIETSAKSVSAAVVENGVPLASAYQNMGLTHSRTLLPLVDSMLKNCGASLKEVEVIAVAAGPGSFTGLRIGVSALKGLAWALEKPCCGVSTLAAMARNLAHMEGLIVCAMDARRNQVYNALFLAHDGVLTRQCPDRAIGLEELAEDLRLNRADPDAARDSLLSTMACKSAIKAGMHTDPAELRRLVDRVQSGEIQYCPHGRPVAVKLSKYQVEKMFKRA